MATAQIMLPPQDQTPALEPFAWDNVSYRDEFSTEGRRDITELFIAVAVLASKSEKLNTEWSKQLRDRNFSEKMSSAHRMKIAAWNTLVFGIISSAATVAGAFIAYHGTIPAAGPRLQPGMTPNARFYQSIAEAVSATAKTATQVSDQTTSYLKGTDDAQAAYTENLLQAAMQASQAARDLREKVIRDGRDYTDLERQMAQGVQR